MQGSIKNYRIIMLRNSDSIISKLALLPQIPNIAIYRERTNNIIEI